MHSFTTALGPRASDTLRIATYNIHKGVQGLGPVQLAHLLQADQVSVQLLHGQAQVMDLQPARRAQALHTLVDVVRGDAQNIGVLHATDCVATRDNGLSRIRRRAPMGLH